MIPKFRIIEDSRGWIIDVRGTLPDGSAFRRRVRPKVNTCKQATSYAEKMWTAAVDGIIKTREPAKPGDQLVCDYAAAWVKERTNRTANDDKTRLELHVLPVIGNKRMRDITKQDIRAIFSALKARLRTADVDDLDEESARRKRTDERRAGKLSAATIRNTFSTVRVMFDQAAADDVVPYTPCVLPPRFLPADDSDITRPFSAAEIEALLGCSAIPPGRRVLYALCFFTGTRIGEAVAFSWRSIAPMEPLRCISTRRAYSPKRKTVGETKTGITRIVPCHPVLAAMLDLWRAQQKNRTDDDLICPRNDGTCQRSVDVWKNLQADLTLLGYGRRKVHALRTTFVSLLRQAKVDKEIIRTMTHGRKASRDILDRNYTTYDWPTLCEAVCQLPVGKLTSMALDGTNRARLLEHNIRT